MILNLMPIWRCLYKRVSAQSKINPSTWSEFAGAWKGVAYRFLSFAESDSVFTSSICSAGDAPHSPDRYVQERELFNFFVSGLSTIEGLCYGSFALGSLLSSSDFPMGSVEQLRAINPHFTESKFTKYYPTEGFSNELKRVLKTTEFREWKNIRNILAHRSAPGRIIYGGNTGKQLPADWKVGISLDKNTTSIRRSWLSSTLSTLLKKLDLFTAKYFFG